MPFSGIGLDFVEEKETGNLIEKYGFPQDKLLFAGVVSGKSFRSENLTGIQNILILQFLHFA